MQRRRILAGALGLGGCAAFGGGGGANLAGQVMTVTGPIAAADLGVTLTHEHILVDFAGADAANPAAYPLDRAFDRALPHLLEAKARGVRTLVETTPAHLGRSPALLRRLSEASGLRIVTNTGFYAIQDGFYVPAWGRSASVEALAGHWIGEFARGVGSGVRPGIVKISLAGAPLAPLDARIVRAAARTSRATGMLVYAHSGGVDDVEAVSGIGAAALDLWAEEGAAPDRWVWVHAQMSAERFDRLVAAARRGAWIAFDNAADAERAQAHADLVARMAAEGLLERVLVAHDNGWWDIQQPDGGPFRGFTALFDHFAPALARHGLGEDAFATLMIDNPARALPLKPPR